jgi:hypothetical protein
MSFHLTFETRAGGSVMSTIDFTAPENRLLDGYFPESGSDGKPVTEAFDVLFAGTSDADLESHIQAVELALENARQHPTGPDGVWVLYSPADGVIDPWQSRLSGGTVLHNDRLVNRWRKAKAKAQVVIERAPWWEAATAVTLNLTNRGGTGADADIVNHQDAGATDDFYVEIAADQVTGVLPTPAIISFKNTVNDATLVDRLIVAHFAASGTNAPPAAADLVFEGAVTADANCSGGSYETLSWANTSENQLKTWTLASGAFRQRNYKVIGRLQTATAYTDLWLKAKLLMGTTVLAETRWSLATAGETLVEVGSLQIPPFRFGAHVDLGNLTLALYEKRAGGSGSLALDFLATLPQDSWRKLEAVGGLAYNETLIDDPTEQRLVTLYSTSSYKVTHVIAEGEPVMLQPGVKNMLYFLHDQTTGAAPIARTATVVVEARPRRLTV